MGRKASVEHKNNIPDEIRQNYQIYYNKWGMPCINHACEECGRVRLVIVGKNGVKSKRCIYCNTHDPDRILKVKQALTNRPFSEEHKKRLSESWQGRDVPDALKKNWEKGRQMSDESRKKMSEQRKGKPVSSKSSIARHQGLLESWENDRERRLRILRETLHTPEALEQLSNLVKKRWSDLEYRRNHSGSNSHQWLGGKSFEPYTAEFNHQLKELIRDRDGRVCQKCGVPESELLQKLDIHHIDYIKENCLPSNLISLCHPCNAKVNRNRDDWKEYFTNLLINNRKKGILGERKLDYDARLYLKHFKTNERIIQ